MFVKRLAICSLKNLNRLKDWQGPRRIVSRGPGCAIESMITHKIDGPDKFMRVEAAGSRIRQQTREFDPTQKRQERLKAKVTLPTVKGYWE
jgi:uncharacterized protein YfiM (DUF2279 family)